MAKRTPTDRTNKFLEITDPKKAVGLWSYHVVKETAMTPVGATKVGRISSVNSVSPSIGAFLAIQ